MDCLSKRVASRRQKHAGTHRGERRRYASRLVAILSAIALLAAAGLPYQGAAQPSTPEAAQFETVNTTDLVNLPTGDFAYSVPLMEVPGPEGGYPINLSYHSGVGPNQEATWVGLGWSLNPGTINRIAKGYPDEYQGAPVLTESTAEGETQTTVSGGVYHMAKFGQVGFNMSLNLNTGTVGANMSVLVSPAEFEGPVTPKAGVSVGTSGFELRGGAGVSSSSKGLFGAAFGNASVTGSVGTGGLGGEVSAGAKFASATGVETARTMGVNVSAGTDGLSASGSVGRSGANREARRSVGFTVSGDGSVSGNFTVGHASGSAGLSTGFSTSAIGSGSVDSWGFKIPVFASPDGWLVTLGVSQKQWTLDEIDKEQAYGYAHLTDYFQDPDQLTPDEYSRKFDRHRDTDMLYASPDQYQVSAQGLSGTFRPFHRQGYKLVDNESKQGSVLERSPDRTDSTSTGDCNPLRTVEDCAEQRDEPTFDTVFRFTNDPGGNYSAAGGSRQMKEPDGTDWYGSKKIEPYYESSTVQQNLLGFVVTTASGKRYVYGERVRSLYEFSFTKNENVGEEDPLRRSIQKGTSYPSQWRLTAVLGPDYVDRGNEGIVRTDRQYEVDPSGIGAEDWGYWVKFTYEETDLPRLWRTPWAGRSPSPRDADVTTFSWGVREEVYLSSIETATHEAEFTRTEAKHRNLPLGRSWVSNENSTPITDNFNFHNEKVSSSASDLTFHFMGDLREFLAYGDPDIAVMSVTAPKNSDSDSEVVVLFNRSSIEFEYRNGFTEVSVPKRLLSAQDADVSKTETATLDGEALFPEDYLQGRKLTRVELREKGTSNVIKTARLRYDYSLRGLSRGSEASVEDGANGGTLTLRTVSLEGRNGATITPPYQFQYANGDEPGNGLNPRWHTDGWDRWGSYRPPVKGNPDPVDEPKHLTPQASNKADKAAAWSLTKITTPTGAQIDVDYESDTYRKASRTYDAEYVDNYSIDTEASRDAGDTGDRYKTNTLVIASTDDYRQQISPGDEISFVRYAQVIQPSDEMSEDGVTRFTGYAGETIKIANVVQVTSSRIVLDEEVTIRTTDIDDPLSNTRKYVWQNLLRWTPERVYGGGSRVRRISTITGIDTMETLYRYRRPNGHSSGVASTLPERHSDSPVRDSTIFEDAKVYGNTMMSHRRPSPSVLYDRVSVINVGPDGAPLNGKTVYEYHTAADYPYKESQPYCSSCQFESRSGIYGRPEAVTQYEEVGREGGAIGDQATFRPVKRRETQYAFGAELVANERVRISAPDQSKRSAPITEGTPLGLSEEIFGFVNANPAQAPDDATVDGRYTGTATHRTYVPYATGSTVKEFVYDGPKDRDGTAMPTKTRHLMWDARTGSVLSSSSQKSDGSWSVTKKTPAHWVYPDMLAKRQLTQNAKKVTYRADESALEDQDIRTYTFDADDVVDASVTTWSNDFDIAGEEKSGDEEAGDGKEKPKAPVWRKNETFGYNPVLAARGDGSVDFDMWRQGTNAPYPEVTPDQPWEMTTNVTKYDRFSHPIEEKVEDGSYASKVFGYERSEVVAVVTDARRQEIAATSFEGIEPGLIDSTLGREGTSDYDPDRPISPRSGSAIRRAETPGGTGAEAAHTGRQYLLLRPSIDDVSFSRTVTAPEAGVYRLTVWTQGGGVSISLDARESPGQMGSGRMGGDPKESSPPPASGEGATRNFQTGTFGEPVSVATVGGWTLQIVDVRIEAAGEITATLASTDGPTRFDAVRLHPVNARMQTFAYAPLTREVTAITGPNHRTTYFEYDDAGRLIRVRDREGTVKKQHRYFAANFVPSVDDDSTRTVVLDASGSYDSAERYRWHIGNDDPQVTDAPTQRFRPTDSTRVVLEVLDGEGRVRARHARMIVPDNLVGFAGDTDEKCNDYAVRVSCRTTGNSVDCTASPPDHFDDYTFQWTDVNCSEDKEGAECTFTCSTGGTQQVVVRTDNTCGTGSATYECYAEDDNDGQDDGDDDNV